MRSTDWNIVMSHVDESCLQDALSSKRTALMQTTDLEKENAMRDRGTTVRKLGRSLIAAAAAVVMVTCIAFAANFLGIREMFDRSGRQLSDDAVSDIRQHQVKGEGAGWDCAVTESLCDSSTALVTIEVSSEDQYVLVPTDALPEDSVMDIGRTGEETLADYAAKRGKKLLRVGANIDGAETLGVHSAVLNFESVSEGEMVILINAQKSTSAEVIDAVCTVTAEEVGGDGTIQKVDLPFTLKESGTKMTRCFAADAQVISGVEFSEARVEETALGLNLEIPVKVLDEDAFEDIMKIDFDGLTYEAGGFVLKDDGTWAGEYSMCQGHVDGELKLLVYDMDKQLLGEIAFRQQ